MCATVAGEEVASVHLDSLDLIVSGGLVGGGALLLGLGVFREADVHGFVTGEAQLVARDGVFDDRELIHQPLEVCDASRLVCLCARVEERARGCAG